MKKLLYLLLCAALLCGCAVQAPGESAAPATEQGILPQPSLVPQENGEISYNSRFDGQTRIELSDEGIRVSGEAEDAVTLSHDIIYYEERDTYDSNDSREPNAIRMQSIFCQRPLYASNQLEKQLERAYFPRLKPCSRIWYKNLIGQIILCITSPN